MARNLLIKLPHDAYKKFTVTHECPLLDVEFRGNSQKLFPSEPSESFHSVFVTSQSSVKTKNLIISTKTGNMALKNFKWKAMAEYPNQFVLEEEQPMIVDPIYLSCDERDPSPCSYPDHYHTTSYLISYDAIN